MHHQHAVVEPHFSFGEARLSEAGTDDDSVGMVAHRLRIALCRSQEGRDGVEITIAPRPEVQPFELPLDADGARLTGLQRDRFAGNDGRHKVFGIRHVREEPERMRLVVLVAHLRLHVYGRLPVGNVEVSGVDVCSGRAQIRVERQRLVELVGGMQSHVLRQTAVVGVEVAVVPLVSAVVLSRAVGPAVVAAHGQHVVALDEIGCQVESEGHHAILAVAQQMAVQVDIGPLPCPLELDEVLLSGAFPLFRMAGEVFRREVLAVPNDGVGQVDDVFAERLVAVEGVWQRHAEPATVVESRVFGFCHVAHIEQPVTVEVVSLSGMYAECHAGQQPDKNHSICFHS